jgi:sigma-B regulation protein RsbU (phosphoserine phosphatase)
MFVTIWLAILDVRTNEIRYTNAGHNPPYIKRTDGSIEKLRLLHGPVAGAMDGLAYGEDRVVAGAGDLLLLFTDGVTEDMNLHSELYGDARLEQWLTGLEVDSVEHVVNEVVVQVKAFEGEAEQADDITILALQVHLGPGEAEVHSFQLEISNDLAELKRVSEVLEAFSEEHGVPDPIAMKVGLAFDELLNNIISYGFQADDTGSHFIEITAELTSNRMTIVIRDDGVPFNPFTLAQPNIELSIEEREIGGLGIELVRKLMDSVAYVRHTDQNVVTLVKILG